MIQFIEKDGWLIFQARVIPKSARNEIVGELDGAMKIKIKAAPVDGAANEELIKFLAKNFNVPKSAVEILGGHTSKTKRVKINGLSAANLPDLKSA